MGSRARCELSAGLTLGPFALVARERLALQVHVKPVAGVALIALIIRGSESWLSANAAFVLGPLAAAKRDALRIRGELESLVASQALIHHTTLLEDLTLGAKAALTLQACQGFAAPRGQCVSRVARRALVLARAIFRCGALSAGLIGPCLAFERLASATFGKLEAFRAFRALVVGSELLLCTAGGTVLDL